MHIQFTRCISGAKVDIFFQPLAISHALSHKLLLTNFASTEGVLPSSMMIFILPVSMT